MDLEKSIKKFYKSLKKLSLINILFIFVLIIVFVFIILKNCNNKNRNIENFENNEVQSLENKYSKKVNNIYDKFYTSRYDAIYLNKNRNNFEIKEIKNISNDESKILDIGCGTGYNVNKLHNQNYDIIGLDSSEHMIAVAKKKYPDAEFIHGNMLKSNLFDFNSFDVITCLGRTIYEIKDKETFIENCYNILEDNGYFIINLIDKDKYNPYVQDNNNENILFNPIKYNKKIDQIIIKFDDKIEFVSNYKTETVSKNNETNDNDIKENYDNINNESLPYAIYDEKFEDFDKNIVHKYELNMYIPNRKNINRLITQKGFKFHKRIDMSSIGHNNEYLFIYKK